MTRKCVVCKKLYIKGSHEIFHSFPKDEVQKKLWLKACKLKLCLPSYRICGDHFLPKHYLHKHSVYLLKNAVPFIASNCRDIQLLDDKGSSSPCPSPMKSSCLEPIASTTPDIQLLDDQGTSSPCPSTSTSKDVEPLDNPVMNCAVTYSPCQSPERKVLNANTIGVLSPSKLRPVVTNRCLIMKKNNFKEKQIENENLKNQIKILKNYTVQLDHDYI